MPCNCQLVGGMICLIIGGITCFSTMSTLLWSTCVDKYSGFTVYYGLFNFCFVNRYEISQCYEIPDVKDYIKGVRALLSMTAIASVVGFAFSILYVVKSRQNRASRWQQYTTVACCLMAAACALAGSIVYGTEYHTDHYFTYRNSTMEPNCKTLSTSFYANCFDVALIAVAAIFFGFSYQKPQSTGGVVFTNTQNAGPYVTYGPQVHVPTQQYPPPNGPQPVQPMQSKQPAGGVFVTNTPNVDPYVAYGPQAHVPTQMYPPPYEPQPVQSMQSQQSLPAGVVVFTNNQNAGPNASYVSQVHVPDQSQPPAYRPISNRPQQLTGHLTEQLTGQLTEQITGQLSEQLTMGVGNVLASSLFGGY